MKRVVKVLAVALALIAILGSCKVVDPCPAYESSIQVENQNSNI